MAIMQTADRRAAFVDFVEEIKKRDNPFNLSKADTQAAVDAADQWASDNALAFNSALPVAARTTLSAAEKALLLAFVVLKRYRVGA